jgi:uncharacterized protein
MSREEIYEQIVKYFSDLPVKKVWIFGSFAREEENVNSDIDMLLEMETDIGMFTLGKYRSELGGILNRKIDVATIKKLRKDFYEKIEKDLLLVYSKK